MKTLYLVDYIGIHCGMHYYLEAFKKQLSNIRGLQIRILSNYSDSTNKPFFINHYEGNTLKKIFSLLRNIIRFRKFVDKHKEDYFVYLTYGNQIDLIFLKICSKVNHIVDIHEAIAQHIDNNQGLKNRFKYFYGNKIKNVISHSQRTDAFLKEYNYTGNIFHVPHFKYIFPKAYEQDSLGKDIKDIFSEGKINFLFFGNINESKGIDILMKAYNLLPAELAHHSNLIIAGKDFDGKCKEVSLKEDRETHLVLRHINDDELIYIYQNADVVCLPYRKTSQSGILEMAFYFKKPILASSVPYFETTLAKFPSFGMITRATPEEYARSMASLITNFDRNSFFQEEDYNRYTHREEVDKFIHEFEHFMQN